MFHGYNIVNYCQKLFLSCIINNWKNYIRNFSNSCQITIGTVTAEQIKRGITTHNKLTVKQTTISQFFTTKKKQPNTISFSTTPIISSSITVVPFNNNYTPHELTNEVPSQINSSQIQDNSFQIIPTKVNIPTTTNNTNQILEKVVAATSRVEYHTRQKSQNLVKVRINQLEEKIQAKLQVISSNKDDVKAIETTNPSSTFLLKMRDALMIHKEELLKLNEEKTIIENKLKKLTKHAQVALKLYHMKKAATKRKLSDTNFQEEVTTLTK